jgi:hypothetical protein
VGLTAKNDARLMKHLRGRIMLLEMLIAASSTTAPRKVLKVRHDAFTGVDRMHPQDNRAGGDRASRPAIDHQIASFPAFPVFL